MARPSPLIHALQSAMVIPKTLFGFLSTAVFFAGFFLIGDVLIAAIAAIAAAVAQFVLAQSFRSRSGIPVWASLAVVLALTGFSMRGDDTFAPLDATQVNAAQPNCHCSPKDAATPAQVTPVPLLDAPKDIAPAPGRV